ncbi:MAG: ChbG/HpnK family deacetylase [Clostridiaceae bacterium]
MKLIINGDDFGLTLGVSRGILKALKEGILTDTSAMANMPRFEESAKLAISEGINEMGVHLNITCGKPTIPVDRVTTLINKNGTFNKDNLNSLDKVDLHQIEEELRGQISRFQVTGLKINHFDGHHHFYLINSKVLEIVTMLAKEYNVPLRTIGDKDNEYVKNNNIKTPNYFSKSFYNENIKEEIFIEIINKYKDKDITLEIMSHPAVLDSELREITSYYEKREEELKILLSKKVRSYINKNNIELIKFSSL